MGFFKIRFGKIFLDSRFHGNDKLDGCHSSEGWNPEAVIFVPTRDYLKVLTEPHVIAVLSNDETGDDAANIAS